jgi:hypothetical protein
MTTIIKNGSKNYQIDTVSNRITMLDARFYQTPSGIFVPSVTTLLEAFPKSSQFYDWLKKNGEDSDEIRDEAGRRGSVVHDLTERYDNGEEVSLMDEQGYIDFKMFEWNCFEKYVEFRNRYEVEIHGIECNMVSETLGMAGTMDRDMTIKIKGKRYLVDIKTSNNIWDEYWLQLVAYQKIAEDLDGANRFDGRAILWLNAKTKTDGKKDAIQGRGWQLIIDEDDPEEQWQVFLATQKLWKAKNGAMQPRQVSYSLTHAVKKTSAEWVSELYPANNLTILDPDGWDRSNYGFSFNEEKITKSEFHHRLLKSTCLIIQ